MSWGVMGATFCKDLLHDDNRMTVMSAILCGFCQGHIKVIPGYILLQVCEVSGFDVKDNIKDVLNKHRYSETRGWQRKCWCRFLQATQTFITI